MAEDDDSFALSDSGTPAPASSGGDGWWDRLINQLPQGVANVGNAIGGGSFGTDLTPEQRTSVGNRALLNFGLNMLGNVRSGQSFAEMFAGGAQAAQQSIYATEQNYANRSATALNTQIRLRQLGLLEQDRQIKLMLLKSKLDALKLMRGEGDQTFGTGGSPGAGAGGGTGGGTGGGAGTVDPSQIAIDDSVPADARPLMQLIAARESGGKPNVYYGGQTFDDLSAFPQWPGVATIDGNVTHASGKYQFQPGTWQRTAARTGINDFSEGSQDKNAFNLASSEYGRQTGGRDLLKDLRDPARADNVFKVLAPTWPTLRGATVADLPGGAGGGRVRYAGPGVPSPAATGPAGGSDDDTFFPSEQPPSSTPAAPAAPAPATGGATPAQPAQTPPELDPMDAEDQRAQARIDQLRAQAKTNFTRRWRIARASTEPKDMEAVQKEFETRNADLDKEQLQLERERRTRKDALAKEGRDRAAAAALKAQEHQQALELERQKAANAKVHTFDTTRGEIDKKTLEESNSASSSARSQLSSIAQLEALLPSIGGPDYLAQAYPQVYKVAQTLRMTPEEFNDKMSAQQAFSAVVNRVAGEMRPTGSGALSDRELDIYRSAFPELSQTDQGRRLILSLMKTAAMRKVQENTFRQNFHMKEKTTAGVDEAMDKSEAEGGLGYMIKRPPALTGNKPADARAAEEYVGKQAPGTIYFIWQPADTGPPVMTWAIQGQDRLPIYAGRAPTAAARL